MRLPTLLLLGGPLLGLSGTGCLTTPVCSAEQILTTDQNGTLLCTAAPAPILLHCSGALISDGKNLGCMDPPDPAELAELTALTSTAADVQKQLAQDRTMPGARYVGVTTKAYPGTAHDPADFINNRQGLTGAAYLCASQFGAGAHMCLMDELYLSATSGTLGSTDTIPPSWIFMPNWNLPAYPGLPEEPLFGVADNCGGYTYGRSGSSRHWAGILVDWSPLPSGDTGFRFRDSLYCNVSNPIACCK